MRDEDARGAGLRDRRQQRRPVGVVGQDEAAIERALPPHAAHAHQARGERHGCVRQPLHPRRASRRQGGEHERARQRLAPHRLSDPLSWRHRDPGLAVRVGHRRHGAVQVNRAVRVIAQFGEHPLRLAEDIAEEDGRPALVAVRAPPRENLAGDGGRRIPRVDRKREGRLGDEGVTGDRLEGHAGRIRLPLVVPGDDPHLATVLDADLRRPEDVAGGMERHPGLADRQGFAVGQCFNDRVGDAAAQNRLARRRAQVARRARTRMVAVRVRHERALDRLPRIDVEVTGFAE